MVFFARRIWDVEPPTAESVTRSGSLAFAVEVPKGDIEGSELE